MQRRTRTKILKLRMSIDRERSKSLDDLSPDLQDSQPLIKNQDASPPQDDENKKNWQFKMIALICSCLLSLGSHYAAHILGSLKGTLKEVIFFYFFNNCFLKKQRNINNQLIKINKLGA